MYFGLYTPSTGIFPVLLCFNNGYVLILLSISFDFNYVGNCRWETLTFKDNLNTFIVEIFKDHATFIIILWFLYVYNIYILIYYVLILTWRHEGKQERGVYSLIVMWLWVMLTGGHCFGCFCTNLTLARIIQERRSSSK